VSESTSSESTRPSPICIRHQQSPLVIPVLRRSGVAIENCWTAGKWLHCAVGMSIGDTVSVEPVDCVATIIVTSHRQGLSVYLS